MEGSYLPPSLGKGRLTRTGTNIVRKEPIEDLTMAMAGGIPKEIRFRKAAKQVVCRKMK